MHRRIRKCVGGEPGEDAWNVFYHNTSWQVLEVRRAENTHPQDQFLWGANYIDAPVVRWHDSNWDGDYADAYDTILYYTYDGNYSVTALVKTDGSVYERYAYDPYGALGVLEADFSADPDNIPDGDNGYGGPPYGRNEILYCGYRHDPESGMYHVRHRYYHPALGRWINRDPAGYVDGMDLYEYCISNPVNLLDYMGEYKLPGKGCSKCIDSSGGRKPLDQWNDPEDEICSGHSGVTGWLCKRWVRIHLKMAPKSPCMFAKSACDGRCGEFLSCPKEDMSKCTAICAMHYVTCIGKD